VVAAEETEREKQVEKSNSQQNQNYNQQDEQRTSHGHDRGRGSRESHESRDHGWKKEETTKEEENRSVQKFDFEKRNQDTIGEELWRNVLGITAVRVATTFAVREAARRATTAINTHKKKISH
jgi:hypothetical protein